MQCTKALMAAVMLSGAVALAAPKASAEGILLAVVNSPVDFSGTVAGQPTGINLILDRSLDPQVPGRSLLAGKKIRIILSKGFTRNSGMKIEGDVNLTMVKGWPQGGLPPAAGYVVGQDDEHTLLVTAQRDIPNDTPANRPGLKVFHVRGHTFINPKTPGQYGVRIEAETGPGGALETGEANVTIIPAPIARIAPTNLLRPRPSNNNFQRVPLNTEAPLTLDLMLWSADGKPINGAGVVAPDPAAYPRYTGGLIVQDQNGDGVLDPKVDRVIGGIIGSAPRGATGQRASSPAGAGGRPVLSGSMHRAPEYGGAKADGIMSVSFRTGNLPGDYRPTFELMGGNAAQFTISAVPK